MFLSIFLFLLSLRKKYGCKIQKYNWINYSNRDWNNWHFLFLVPSAEEDIHMLAERVLQETIIEDYHVRSNTEPIYSRPGGRKIKNYQIETEKGVETFSFKDSIDEYRANQLVTQYLLAEYSPINPDTFYGYL